MASKPTTEKVRSKEYECSECGHREQHSTNHYGEIYVYCKKCSWKSPMSHIKAFRCCEAVPAYMDVPEPWMVVKLSDICEIK